MLPEIDPVIRIQEMSNDNNYNRVQQAFILERWLPIKSPQLDEIVDIIPGNDSGYCSFVEALKDIGCPVELKSVIDAVKAQCWE